MPNLVSEDEEFSLSAIQRSITVALAGNPNSGKTTIFNALTGARQHVGNYPGVTVEKKEGTCQAGGVKIRIVDLPGTYSLAACSVEELVARDFLTEGSVDVVIDILDAGNLERNLYLAVQIMELGVPQVLALNMSDVAQKRGIEFDIDLLEKLLGVRVVATVGHKGAGKNELLSAAVSVVQQSGADAGGGVGLKINYGHEIEEEIAALEKLIEGKVICVDGVPVRWLAVKLLEGDGAVMRKIADEEIIEASRQAIGLLGGLLGESIEAVIANCRYGFISGVCRRAVRSTVESARVFSDRIDEIVTHRVLGLPIFMGMMYVVFHLTFSLADPAMGWIESGFEWLGGVVGGLWAQNSDSLLRSLLVDGIIGGVGGVLVFLPNILLLFLAIAVLEDSGYMARAAFLVDRLMNRIGLHGKSFVPMLIGFGCSVPAIMATRTLETRRDRLTTMMVVPLMSCGARLPIYALIIPAFFPQTWHAPMLWIIYMVGIILAIVCAKLLKMTVLRGQTPPFVMELPPYRMPTLKSVGMHMWNRGGAYLKKAGTVILGISVLLWAMQQWPGLDNNRIEEFETRREIIFNNTTLSDEAIEEQLERLDFAQAEARLEASLMGRVGKGLEKALKPCGFDWKISTAMIGAFAAKEVFVSQMGIVYSLGEQDEDSQTLREKLQANYTPLVGLCIMLFCLISAPCMATIAVTWRESGSWKWALFQLVGLTVLAWVVTAAVYQVGRLVV